MYMENPKECIKNHDLSKNTTFLLSSACIMYGKEINFTIKLPFSLINSLLSSQNIWLGSCPNNTTTCSFYTLRNMAEYKNKCQVIIFSSLNLFTVVILSAD